MAESVQDTKDTVSTESPAASDTEAASNKVTEKALLRKLDARLLPAVGILYLLSFLDHSNGKYD
jgi:hypothetical protein